MPLVAEARRQRADVRASISSQFWEQPVHSTKSLDGQLWSLPAEPPALSLTGSSGLSRTQQLIAAQAVRLPFLPSYDGSSDGVVLDRVIARAGGQRWWTALSGRVKAQRLYNLAKGSEHKVDALRDLSNYALCARGRIQLGRRLTFNGMVEAHDADKLQRRVSQRVGEYRSARAAAAAAAAAAAGDAAAGAAASDGQEAAAGGAAADAGPPSASTSAPASRAGTPPRRPPALRPPALEPVTAHAALRCALPGHDLCATAGYNLEYVDSSGDAAHVPLAVSLDLASHDRQDGLQYRVGLHQVTAPTTELAPRAGALQRWRTSLHAQGALAVEGEAYIWRGAPARDGSSREAGAGPGSTSSSVGGGSGSPGVAQPNPDSPAATSKQQQQQQKSGGGVGGGEEGGEEGRQTKLASALASAAAAEEDPMLRKKQGGSGAGPAASADAGGGEAEGSAEAQPSPAAAAAAAAAQPADGSEGQPGKQQGAGAALEQFIRPLEHLGEQVGGMLHHATHPSEQQQQQQGPADAGSAGSSSQEPSTSQQQQQGGGSSSGGGAAEPGPQAGPSSLLGGLSAQAITSAIQDSVALLQQVKENVGKLTTNVQDGSLQRLSQQLAESRAAPQRQRPYSVLLAQPHLKLNAALGCLARMPLPALRSFSFPTASLEPIDYHHHPSSGAVGGGGVGVAGARHPSTSSLVSRASHSSHLAEAWQPYLKGTALRVFASAGVSGQLGRFARPYLDYTAASARVDVGLTSPHVVGVVPDASALAAAAADGGHRPDKHRAFALEGRGAWHALSVSLAQQVVGPVRARVDARFALDPTSVPASEGERSTLKGVLQTALSVRPSLLEAVYGFDCVLPGTEGAARLAVWFSPKRRECMAELRLF